jgi:multidrug efflux system membrane fusion protein
MDRQDPNATAGKTRPRWRFPLGAALAVLGVALLTALVWFLTKKPPTPGISGAPPGAAAPARPSGPGGARGGAPATVGVAQSKKSDIPLQIDALGTIASPAAATVRAQVSGVLQKIHFTEGETVKQGQLLAQVDPRPYEMALMQASGQRQRDEAQLENARLVLKRYQTLLEQDSIARQDVDTQAALVKQLEGTVVTDRAAEGTARINLGYTRVVAPIAGKIGLRAVDLGNVVGPGDANGLVVITQMTPIDATFSIAQDQLTSLRQRLTAGEQMKAVAWDRGRTQQLASGRFLALDNQVDVQTGTARAKARFTNEDLSLTPGQFVNIRLQLGSLPDSVTIPVSALRHGSNGDYVFLLNAESKTVSLRSVQAGPILDDQVQILSGLTPGMSVITEGGDRLRDGSSVILPGAAGARTEGGGRGMRGEGTRGEGRRGEGRRSEGAAQAAPQAATQAAPKAAPQAAPQPAK